MSNSRPSSARSAGELRAAAQDRLQEQRQRRAPGWLASQGRRRAVALIPAAVFGLGVLAAAAGRWGYLFLVVAAGLSLAAAVVLPKVTQQLASAPDGLLDERETSQRDRAYRQAFSWVLVLLGALWVLALTDGLVDRLTGTALFQDDGTVHLALATLLAAAALPTAVLTWTWRPPVDDRDE